MKKGAIMCVDDEEIVLTSLKGVIKKHFGNDYSLELVTDALEALDIIDELFQEGMEVLVVISDWLMPDMKGDEFLIEVHRRFPKIVKMILTGQADKSAITRAELEAELFGYIQKPWSEEELVKKIRECLEDTGT